MITHLTSKLVGKKTTFLMIVIPTSMAVIMPQIVAKIPTHWQLAETFQPPDNGAPGDRQGSGSRNLCSSTHNPLTALIPDTNMGFTISDRPTFWFYVPSINNSSNSPISLEFILMDNNEETVIYKTTFSLSNSSSIIGIKIPDNFPPLSIGKTYRWHFAYICNPNNRTDDIFVRGAIKKVPLTPAFIQQIASAKQPMEKVRIYSKYGLWYDTLTTLTQLQINNPQNLSITKEWAELLESIGLDYIAKESLLQYHLFRK